MAVLPALVDWRFIMSTSQRHLVNLTQTGLLVCVLCVRVGEYSRQSLPAHLCSERLSYSCSTSQTTNWTFSEILDILARLQLTWHLRPCTLIFSFCLSLSFSLLLSHTLCLFFFLSLAPYKAISSKPVLNKPR